MVRMAWQGGGQGFILLNSTTLSRVRCGRCVPAALRDWGLAAKLQVSRQRMIERLVPFRR